MRRYRCLVSRCHKGSLFLRGSSRPHLVLPVRNDRAGGATPSPTVVFEFGVWERGGVGHRILRGYVLFIGLELGCIDGEGAQSGGRHIRERKGPSSRAEGVTKEGESS